MVIADSSAIKYNDDMLYTRMCVLACMCIPYMQKRENTRRNTLECYGSNTSHRKRTIGPLAQFVRFFSRLYICAVNRNSISRRCVAGSRKWWISKVHTYIVFDGDIQPYIDEHECVCRMLQLKNSTAERLKGFFICCKPTICSVK